MFILIATSFIAGILTVLTPCTLPLLPLILGGSVQNTNKRRPILIIISLALSVLIFTLIFKSVINAFTTDLQIIRVISGLIILALGLFYLFPNIWTKLTHRLGVHSSTNLFLTKSQKFGGDLSAILTGLALGPVFSSCSPMFGYILFAILPLNFIEGLICLIFFILGMSLFLILISVSGQKFVQKTKWATNPNGKLTKTIGIIFIIVGILIIFRIDKSIESFLLEQPFILNILPNRIEQNIINSL
jgi:cytochrome c-type biogenesis protein